MLRRNGRGRPVARDFHDVIAAAPVDRPRDGWLRLTRMQDLRPGDVIAWRRPPTVASRIKVITHLRAKLAQWGGNSSGVNIANIDNLGNVHPDTFWWDYTLGNVKTRPFSEIWRDTSDPLMAGLKSRPRPVKGRCARCSYFDVCGGNTRVRAWQIAKDAWAEDPGCYLDDDELGIEAGGERLVAKPYVRVRRADSVAETVPTVTPGEART